MPSLITDRLELRPLPAAVAQALAGERGTAAELLGATMPEPWPQRELLAVLPHQALSSPEEEQFGIWVMIERSTNTVVGDIGFLGRPDSAGKLEVGYSVIPERRRRGYATEALFAMLEWAFGQAAVRSVIADCDADNVASIRTLERGGFRRTSEAGGKISWATQVSRREAPQGRGEPR